MEAALGVETERRRERVQAAAQRREPSPWLPVALQAVLAVTEVEGQILTQQILFPLNSIADFGKRPNYIPKTWLITIIFPMM